MSTWMVVEDEPDIYEVLLAMFEMWGIEGVAFVEGEEAAAWIDDVDSGRFIGELPELALIDIRLPGPIKGHMVAQRLRQSPALGRIAIVLITAFKLTPDEHAEIMAFSSADELIYKPLPQFDDFKRRLETVLAQRRTAAAPAPSAAAPAQAANSEPTASATPAAPEPVSPDPAKRDKSDQA
ncbi:MAG: response regulator [Aggregatilineales bacterium]